MSFSEIFFISFMTATFAFLTIAVRQCYKCKISELSCCGVVIKRDVITEEKEAEMRTQNGIPDTSRISSLNNPISPIRNGEQKV